MQQQKKSQKMSHKTAFLISAGCIIVVAFGMLAKNILVSAVPPVMPASSTLATTSSGILSGKKSATSTASLMLPTGKYILEISDTDASREQGLSGRDPLGKHEGMLFVFNSSGLWNFWMKDMKFNLDILWLDEDYNVVSLSENISPGTYPKTFSTQYLARYVLEANAGFVKDNGIKLGSKLDIKK